jgi:hypothetical protein
MQTMVTLTAEESLRLIAQAIVALKAVKYARQKGFIGFSLCTSAAYIIQELLGKESVVCRGF